VERPKGGARRAKKVEWPGLPVKLGWYSRQRRRRHQGNYSLRDGEAGQSRDGVDVELAHDSLAMGFHCAHSDLELTGNFLVALTFGKVPENLLFPVRQRGSPAALPLLRTTWLRATRATSGLKCAVPACTASMARTISSGGASFKTIRGRRIE